MSFLSADELADLGFRSYGRDVLIDRHALFFGANRITLGDNVRIDCFSMISAGPKGIVIGSHIHISSGVYIYGTGDTVELRDFCGLSPGAKLFTATDDFSEGYLRGPQVPREYRKLKTGRVILGENVQIGAGAIVLPGVELGRNASLGALSLLSKSVLPDRVVAGIPAKELSVRDGKLADRLMSDFLKAWNRVE